MSGTNFTDIDSLLPALSAEAVDGSMEVGLIESSVLKIIPKFFKAIATLLISGLLLGVTFLLITLWKRGCRTHRKLEEDKATNGSPGSPLHSVVVTPPNEDDPGYESRAAHPSSSNLQPIKSKYMNVPKHNLRRASGPFGSEALSFAVEQYTMKHMEKEIHVHHNLHGHHDPAGHSTNPNPHGSHQHIRSGASNAGQDPSLENENETKSKWNCFKGSKE